jgi:hypothetical protein
MPRFVPKQIGFRHVRTGLDSEAIALIAVRLFGSLTIDGYSTMEDVTIHLSSSEEAQILTVIEAAAERFINRLKQDLTNK